MGCGPAESDRTSRWVGRGGRCRPVTRRDIAEVTPMLFLLWFLAVLLVVAGIVQIVRGAVLFGVILIIVGLLVGPGGVSLFA
jgi:hypothetical protein